MSKEYQNERERTGLVVNHGLTYEVDIDAITGVPQMHAAQLPEGVSDLIPFDEILTDKDPEGKGVHFFRDDYRFERFWRQPERYLPFLQRYNLVCSPDFSLYTDFPLPVQRWNQYRNQLLGAWMQARGVNVIPTVSWSSPDSFAWAFDGLPDHSALAVSSVGCLIHKEVVPEFLHGVETLLDRKRPTELLLYGRVPPALAEMLIAHGVPWQQFAHAQAARWRAAVERKKAK